MDGNAKEHKIYQSNQLFKVDKDDEEARLNRNGGGTTIEINDLNLAWFIPSSPKDSSEYPSYFFRHLNIPAKTLLNKEYTYLDNVFKLDWILKWFHSSFTLKNKSLCIHTQI